MRTLVAVLLMLLLSGCFQPEPAPEGLPVDAKGRVLPTVHGVVVDEAIRPLPGVRVHFLGTQISTITDKNGEYALYSPVEEFHNTLVTAFLHGYWPRTQQVQVSSKISAQLDFNLAINANLLPHAEVLKHTGYARCDARVAAGGQNYSHDCTSDARSDGGNVANWMWELTPTPELSGAVVQVNWNPAWPDSQRLHVWLVAPMAGGVGGQVLADVTSTSPIRLEVPEQVARAMPDWTTIRLHVDIPQSGGQIPGVTAMFARDQLYQAVATLFYVDAAPPGYQVS